MYDRTLLLKDCQGLVKRLEKDIRERTTSDPELAAAASKRYQEAIAAKNTAMAEGAWLSEQVTQAAVAWALGTVFVRFCEDNGLIDQAWIAGPTDDDATKNRYRQSELAREAYIVEHPTHTDVQYLQASFRAVGAFPATKDLFAADRNPLWTLPVSAQGARHLIGFWREADRNGKLLRNLWIEDIGDTRWLGDLYQDMSADARKRYALLQTPDFVEEFILDYTLSPAIKSFGLKDLRCIDPTCGSGHFLLGILKRLIAIWEQELGPTGSRKEAVSRAMRSVYGIDLNPFAVAISRFRLVLAGMAACSWRRLKDAPAFGFSLAVGNTLTLGVTGGFQGNFISEDGQDHPDHLTPGEYQKAKSILSQRYHVVVGNPPYINVDDEVAREAIKRRYATCFKTWTLSVPFTERFFGLAKADEGGGFVGYINSNNFARRDFGLKLVTKFFQTVRLTHVVDTSNANIPGHGTATVIIAGRNTAPSTSGLVRTAIGLRGDPADRLGKNIAWNKLVDALNGASVDDKWVALEERKWQEFCTHPWSFSGGTNASVRKVIETSAVAPLQSIVDPPIGRAVRIALEEAFDFSNGRSMRSQADPKEFFGLVTGDAVRDYSIVVNTVVWNPYTQTADSSDVIRQLWLLRTSLKRRATFGGTMESTGMRWYEYQQYTKSAYTTPLSICFPDVATNPHFAIDRGGNIFKAHAPVIKLHREDSLDRHLALIGILGSSTVCFYLKQICHCKGSQGVNEGTKAEKWEQFFEFNSNSLATCPIPKNIPPGIVSLANKLDEKGLLISREIAALRESADPAEVARSFPGKISAIRAEMIFLQEELDWLAYLTYGILDENECPLHTASAVPLALGERAFEIDLARKVAADVEETSWFERHRSKPISEIPAHWPVDYQQVVRRRLELIISHPYIGLLEKPEHKRRWQSESWSDVVQAGLYAWLCDRLEDRSIWSDEPRLTSAQELADRLFVKPEVVKVASLFRGNDIFDRVKLVEELLVKETVPYIPAIRYTDEGMLKRADWEAVWDLQRREDSGEPVNIPIPPRYTKEDFRTGTYWNNRGKLDIPKERFISFPGAEREPNTSTLVMWAGYNHAQQARALIEHYQWAKSTAGWDAPRLIPMLIGLDQLIPWIKQWHNEMDPTYGSRFGDVCSEFLLGELQDLGVKPADLRIWRPVAGGARRGRKRKGEA